MEVSIDVETLRALNGTALKVYIVLSNSSDGASAKELATKLGVTERAIRKAIVEWNENAAAEQKFQKKEQKFHIWNKSSVEKESTEKENSPNTQNGMYHCFLLLVRLCA